MLIFPLTTKRAVEILLGDMLPSFEYYSPASLNEAVELLTTLEGAMILQGGTDLLVAAKVRGLKPKYVVSLRKLKATMGTIREDKGGIVIGASCTFDTLEESELIQEKIPALHEAVRLVGSRQIRSKATIGGNLCNASPAADSAPPLLVLETKLKVHGADGEREIPIEQFFRGPGKTSLKRGDILTELIVPLLGPNSGTAFAKLGRIDDEDISVVSAAAYVSVGANGITDARIALGSVAPTPMRAHKTEELLRGRKPSDELMREAGRIAMSECSPITDVRAGASYRRRIVAVLVESTIREALRRASVRR
jgi:carbon-monoxide dehydrogenase medium subunit